MGTLRFLWLAALIVWMVLGVMDLSPSSVSAETFDGIIVDSMPDPADGGDAALHKGIPAAEEEGEDSSKPLTIEVRGDWVSKYMFRGFDVLDDRAAWQPSLDIGFDNGLHFNLWSSMALSGRFSRGEIIDVDGQLVAVDTGLPRTDELDELDYTVYYTKSCLNEALDTEVGMTYYDVYPQSSENLDSWEWYGKLTLSKLPLEPHAYLYYGVPKRRAIGGEGWMTCLGGSHTCELGAFPCLGSTDPVSLTFVGDVWYNGGELLNGVDTGWTHAVFGSSLTIPLCNNLSFTPGVYYQVSMEDTVNEDDELWTQLSLAYTW